MTRVRAIFAHIWPLALLLVVIATGVWALLPLRDPSSGADPLAAPAAHSFITPVSAGPVSAPFRDEIWPDQAGVATLEVASSDIAVSAVAPLHVTLLGVSRDKATGAARVALYDAEMDSVHIVGEGDSVGRVVVRRIDASGVDISDAGREARLDLRGATR
jgi:hypothetical protein